MGCYYLFESLASGRSCYYESEEEVQLFQKLFKRYMEKYVEIHKMYLSSEGYQILLRVRLKETVLRNYRKECEKEGKETKGEYIKEPWRIISEQMRKFKSLYVRAVNKIRRREGVLVKGRFMRYYFESKEVFDDYINKMDSGERIRSQRNGKYGVSERWVRKVKWSFVRGKEWVEMLMDRAFQKLVVSKLILKTLKAHSKTLPLY
jgi:hypothetical protein